MPSKSPAASHPQQVTRSKQALLTERLDANPYLCEFRQHNGSFSSSSWEERPKLVRKYAWAVPNAEAILKIAAVGPIVEIGAGSGYWARQVAEAGGDIRAFDNAVGVPREPGYGPGYGPVGTHFPVEEGGVEKARSWCDRALFLCWPPYGTSMADDALAAYEESGGKCFIYIGEDSMGCTGDDAFHARLKAPEWVLTDRVHIPQWQGIHDTLCIYRRA